RVEELAGALGVLERVLAAPYRAADGAGLDAPRLDADVHLGRGADEVLAAEIEEEPVRARVHRHQRAVERRGQRRAGLVEALARHDLEEVAAAEIGERLPHDV